MTGDHLGEDPDLPAGAFSSWVVAMQRALLGEGGTDVPCGTCTACCTSSQFVHIEPDETDTLAHIPAEVLFPAPLAPRGHVLLGYDERGHCPMLVDNACSIYEHRPRACRTYDCRIFPAAGVAPDGDDKGDIARRARRWRFDYAQPGDRTRHDAVRAAASYLREQAAALGPEHPVTSVTKVAVTAVRVHEVFLRRDGATGETAVVDPGVDVVRAEIARRTGPQPAS